MPLSISKDIGAFVSLLEDNAELHRVTAAVDPVLEIAAITDRVCKSGGGPALFFESVRGHAFPVLTNLFGSLRRTAWALGCQDVEVLAGRLAGALAKESGGGDERLRNLTARPGFQPKMTQKAPCREVTEDPDLLLLPALQSWPEDGGRFLTLPQVLTRDPETGERNCGMYRMQIFDGRTAGLHWRAGSDADRHHAAWRRRGERMPVAVALGGPPALTYAAGAPLPPRVDEVAFSGFLSGEPLELTSCLTCDLTVPAGAEFVLEGYVEPGEEREEGPFGNHTGAYAPPAPVPVFHLTSLTRRHDPLYPATIVGPPPMEDCWLAKATERLFLPLLRIDFPEIVDLCFPIETIFHGCALISVRADGVRKGRELIRDLWRTALLRSSRLLVLLGEEVDVQQPATAYWRAVNQADPGRDLVMEEGRLGIDATRPLPGGVVEADAATRRLVEARWQEYGIE